MQNFVSKCIQTINNHRSPQALDNEPYNSTTTCPTQGTPFLEASNVIGALPPTFRGVIPVPKRGSRSSPASASKEQPELDLMINSLPTLSPSNLQSSREGPKQVSHLNPKSSSDQNVNGGSVSEESVTSQHRRAVGVNWVDYQDQQREGHFDWNSPVHKSGSSTSIFDKSQISSCISWVNSQTKKYIPYTVMDPPMHATVLIGGAEPSKKTKSKKSSMKSSMASAVNSSAANGSNLKTWMVENLSRDMRDGTIFGILLEVLSGEDLDIDRSIYRSIEGSGVKSKEEREGCRVKFKQQLTQSDTVATQNIFEILNFLKRKGINCNQISPEDIVFGDEDSIVKLILLIASHYKPENFQHNTAGSNKPTMSSSSSNQQINHHLQTQSTQHHFPLDNHHPHQHQVSSSNQSQPEFKFSAPDYQMTQPSGGHGGVMLQFHPMSGIDSNKHAPSSPPNGVNVAQRPLPPHRTAFTQHQHQHQQPQQYVHAQFDHLKPSQIHVSSHQRNEEQSLIESAPSLSLPQPERLQITKTDLTALKVTLDYLQNHEAMKTQQCVVVSSRKSSDGNSSEDVVTSKRILGQLQEMLILSQPPDGESETGDDTEASSCGNSSGHQTMSQSTNGSQKNQLNQNKVNLKSKKRSQSREKNAQLGVNRNSVGSHKQVNNNEILLNQLRSELFSSKQEWYNMQNCKSGLESRLMELEQAHRNLQGDYSTLQRLQGDTQSKMIEMQRKLDQQEILIIDLNRKLAHKDKSLDQKRKVAAEYQSRLREAEEQKTNLERENERRALSTAKYQREVHELQYKLQKSLKSNQESGESQEDKQSSHRLRTAKSPTSRGRTSRGRQDSHKEKGRNNNSNHNSSSECSSVPVLPCIVASEEYRMISSAVLDMKKHFDESDPEFHSLETIEQSLESLIEKLARLKNEKEVNPEPTTEKTNSDSDEDPIEVVAKSKFRSHRMSEMMTRKPAAASTTPSENISANQTQVFYFTNSQTTPCITTIPKPLDSITLGDFKKFTVDIKDCRYLFKTMDSEFGAVKEEVDEEFAIVPSYNRQITAWIEQMSD